MAKTQLTKRPQLISYRRALGALVATIVAFLLLLSVITIAGKYFAIRRHIRDLETERATLTNRQNELKNTNAYLATPAGQEQALRDKYNIAKPGEGVIVVTTTSTTVEHAPQSKIASWWQSLLRGLGLKHD